MLIRLSFPRCLARATPLLPPPPLKSHLLCRRRVVFWVLAPSSAAAKLSPPPDLRTCSKPDAVLRHSRRAPSGSLLLRSCSFGLPNCLCSSEWRCNGRTCSFGLRLLAPILCTLPWLFNVKPELLEDAEWRSWACSAVKRDVWIPKYPIISALVAFAYKYNYKKVTTKDKHLV